MTKMVKKTIELNQEYIDRLRTIFQVKTDKEAVNRALEIAIMEDEIIRAHKDIEQQGDIIEDIFK